MGNKDRGPATGRAPAAVPGWAAPARTPNVESAFKITVQTRGPPRAREQPPKVTISVWFGLPVGPVMSRVEPTVIDHEDLRARDVARGSGKNQAAAVPPRTGAAPSAGQVATRPMSRRANSGVWKECIDTLSQSGQALRPPVAGEKYAKGRRLRRPTTSRRDRHKKYGTADRTPTPPEGTQSSAAARHHVVLIKRPSASGDAQAFGRPSTGHRRRKIAKRFFFFSF